MATRTPKNRTGSQTTITSIPPEIIEKIFIHVIDLQPREWRKGLKDMALVCRSWSSIARRLSLLKLDLKTMAAMNKALSRAKELRSGEGFTPTRILSLRVEDELTTRILPELVATFATGAHSLQVAAGFRPRSGGGDWVLADDLRFPKLHELELTYLLWNETVTIFKRCDPAKLQSIHIYASHADVRLFEGMVLPNLRNLRLGNPAYGVPATKEDFGRVTPNLEELAITVTRDSTDAYAPLLDGITPGRLRFLRIMIWEVDGEVQSIRHPALRSLLKVVQAKGWFPILEIGVRVMMRSWTLGSPDWPRWWDVIDRELKEAESTSGQ